MVNRFQVKPINIAVQKSHLEREYPNAKITLEKNILVWSDYIKPTPVANEYRIKMVYKHKQHPNVYVVKPNLDLFPEAKSLPHVYSTEKQWLCLYYRRAREWKSNMLLSKTVIPWTREWLYFYELWLATGKWMGGGIEHH